MARFNYDSFGNLRNASGTGASLPGNAGGDFRFQGQWLDEATGLYNFRARYYDPETGRFMSYDPIELIEMEPESSNPYQFVYNNPHVYSDPTGMMTITEVNASQIVSDILATIRANAAMEIRQLIIERAQGIATDALVGLIKTIVPFDFTTYIDGTGSEGLKLDELFRDTLCNVLGSSHNAFLNNLWLEVRLDKKSGTPVLPGYGCGPIDPFKPTSPAIKPSGYNDYSHPDFLFKSGEPVATDRNPLAYTIGDLKFSINSFAPQSNAQFNSILSYAKLVGAGSSQYKKNGGHQYVPLALYITVNSPPAKIEAKVKEWALDKHGVILEIVSFK